LLEQLPNPLTGKPRLRTQQPVHLVAERIELRRPRRTPITRRLNRAQRPSDRVTAVARAPDDLLDRQPLHEIQATDLRPLLHPPPRSTHNRDRGSRPPRTPPQAPPGGSAFNRPKGVSIHPASILVTRALLYREGGPRRRWQMRRSGVDAGGRCVDVEERFHRQ